ncbi:TraR/DksA C4-type zinc finger protein [Nocardia paucivorans]|uniref:TraR/DksA C4-type zinc finger protein n=1 Tax=Nocardia paucivorans TaxID=114259 RepID=UPI0012F86CAE|nr:TraR/DksA C4-type zinc finger protein [Nocardia paucivorans]
MIHTHPVSRARLTDRLPTLRAALHRQRRFRLRQLAELEAEIDRATPTDAADTARHEVTVKLAAAARQALADIEESLTLIATGRYGRCRGCHDEIPIHLLQIIPTSQWCLNCRRDLPSDNGAHRSPGPPPDRTPGRREATCRRHMGTPAYR